MTKDDEVVMHLLTDAAKRAGYQTRMAAEGQFSAIDVAIKACVNVIEAGGASQVTSLRESETNELTAWEIRRDHCVGDVHDVETIGRSFDEAGAKYRVLKLFRDSLGGFDIVSAICEVLEDGRVMARVKYNDITTDSWWTREVRVTQTVEWKGDK